MRKLLIGICFLLAMMSYPSNGLSSEPSILGRIIAHAEKNNIDPALAVAFAEVESSLDPQVRDRYEPKYNTYSVGLFQVFIPTARSMGFRGTREQLKAPNINIQFGLAYLQKCTDQYDGIHDIACCYNAGEAFLPATCEKKEVREYITKIRDSYRSWTERVKAHLFKSASAQ